jgi:two-component system, OmpR family, response regulator ResD
VSVTDAPRPTVLVVEDEPTIGDMVGRYLERAGISTEIVRDGEAALASIGARRPDLVVLDVMLPGMNGLEVMRRVRETDRETGIVLLTARGEEADRVTGLEAGADDYVIKPFASAELVARVNAVLRRVSNHPGADARLAFDGLVIDVGGHRVTRDDEEITLTQREFELLLFLAHHAGQAFSRDELMKRVWRYSFYTDTATVTVHMRRLRAKLERDPSAPLWLETVWGTGYRFRG